jgi:hypothetical protein
MRLVETNTGFVLKPDHARLDPLGFAKALLDFLRQRDTPFVIGGSAESHILTIRPRCTRQHDELKAWWIAWQAQARPGPQ